MENSEINTPIELIIDPVLKTIWVDTFQIGLRDDNLCLLRFLSSLPEGLCEQSRLITSTEKLKKFIDLLCFNIDYYPSKQTDNDSNEKSLKKKVNSRKKSAEEN